MFEQQRQNRPQDQHPEPLDAENSGRAIDGAAESELGTATEELQSTNLAGPVRSTSEVLGQTNEELRALFARLFTAQEDERRRVARELHDDISQKLALLENEIERARQDLPGHLEQLSATLLGLRQRTAALSNDVRRLSHALHPSALDDLGLPTALKSLVDQFAESEGMIATFRRRTVPDAIPIQVSTALYRIAQEALHNVARHAGRTHVKVLLEGSDGAVRLSIRDFGEGFDMQGTGWRGLGLLTMEERTRLVGGALSIESELGQGTSLVATVPLAANSKA